MPEPHRLPLAEAVARFVEPGMHLHFASTPSRSNAAIREVSKRFLGQRPGFTISTSGFHSLAHLLGLLRLGRRYIACFFGDNYPVPRPNRLYAALEAEGADIEHWSLLAYVSALRAGALGQPYAVIGRPTDTDLERDLARRSRYFAIADPADPGERLGLVAALRADITFVHAAAADEDGHILGCAPYGEGFWSALGATRGTIVTVERIVSRAVARRHRGMIVLPPHRVLAFAVEPFGAHPQPLYAAPDLEVQGYRDDYEDYAIWRVLAQDPAQLPSFVERVLQAEDSGRAYADLVGPARLSALQHTAPLHELPSGPGARLQAAAEARMIVLAARHIVRRVRHCGYRVLLAGIGHAFFAARLARRFLQEEGLDVPVMVETGLYDLDCGAGADSFLLSHANIAGAARHSNVEDVLGALTCGADNRCLGVLGAAQIDQLGRLNSTRLADGALLVGSGGAADIAAAAAEVVVVTLCDRDRLVADVDYITSTGEGVLGVATDRCVLTRVDGARASWWIEELYPVADVTHEHDAVTGIAQRCGFPLSCSELRFTSAVTESERAVLRELDVEGRYQTPDQEVLHA